ncbi:D-mannonate oxidoreductase, partial [Tamlana fucoidanivorans]
MSKTIVVTGAGGVLCSTLASALAKQGNKIALLDLN